MKYDVQVGNLNQVCVCWKRNLSSCVGEGSKVTTLGLCILYETRIDLVQNIV